MSATCQGCGVTSTIGPIALATGRTSFYCVTIGAYSEVEIVEEPPELHMR